MTTNLSLARTTIDQLRTGSQQIVQAVDGKTLSGAAYQAGKGLFSELIIPTVNRVNNAVQGIQSDRIFTPPRIQSLLVKDTWTKRI